MAVRCRLIGGSFGWSFGGLRSTGILSFSERLKCVRMACQACRRHASAWRCFPSPFLSEFCAKTGVPKPVQKAAALRAEDVGHLHGGPVHPCSLRVDPGVLASILES